MSTDIEIVTEAEEAPASPAPEQNQNEALQPIEAELRALREFVSKDPTRMGGALTTVWRYESDGGLSLVATDGHTLCLRRAGTHRTMGLFEVSKQPATNEGGLSCPPPPWSHLVDARDGRKPKDKPVTLRSVEPTYVARIGLVEKAVTKRRETDIKADGRFRGKELKRALTGARSASCAVLELYGEMDPWYFKIDAPSALWEILVMPRQP